MRIAYVIPLVKAWPHLRTIERYIIGNLTFFPCYDRIIAILTKFLLVILKDAFFVAHALYNDGVIDGDCLVNHSESLLLRRRAIWDWTLEGVAVRMGWFKSAMTCNLEGNDGFGIFWEADGRNTKELCSLLLRAWSKEIEVNWAGRTNLGGEDGLMPANHRHENAVKQSFWIPTGSA